MSEICCVHIFHQRVKKNLILHKIEIREEYFNEIVAGYLGEMQSGLSKEELYFIYSGKFAIYMQALRFLTDYLNDDIYYNIQYEAQNFIRACNQIVLLKKFIENEKRFASLKRMLVAHTSFFSMLFQAMNGSLRLSGYLFQN